MALPGGETYTIPVNRGDYIIAALQELCDNNQIDAAFFYGIGAVDYVKLAHYNVTYKEYSQQTFDQPFEVTNLTGSIALYNSERIIHAHITLSDTEMHAFGGHLDDARVSGTMEIFLTTTDPLYKKYDQETGLKIFDLDSD